ncbi:hypothetical protein BH24ACI4_BH24ACI4_06150 [soil metagenome]
MGADQSLYAYVGERILAGERPYVDAWDQKPPAIHYTYALLRAVWPADGAVAAADALAAAGIAALLFLIGRELTSRSVGVAAALVYLLLSNPAFFRLGGVRVRGQAEIFIALAVTAAAFLLIRSRPLPASLSEAGGRDAWRYAGAGLLLGAAFTFKYNAGVYGAAAAAGVLGAGALTFRRAGPFAAGYAALPLAFLLIFTDALGTVYDATVLYNVRYSGETYSGPLHFLTYLLTFPIQHARVDALWTLGGAGCAVLLVAGVRDRARLIPVIWVAAACLSVAINGSRGLPQYFVQAGPGLALAAAWGGALAAGAVRERVPPMAARAALTIGMLVVAVAVARVNQFSKLAEQTLFDAQALAGRMTRETYLARYVDGQKYTALGAAQVGRLMQAHSAPDTPVYLFGFTPAAYLHADRVSASRFFWSRPVIAGFNEGRPGYGVAGVRAELERARPAVVALQVDDWAPDVTDSAEFFLTTPVLAEWLRSEYRQMPGPDGFDVWIRRE